MKMEGRMKGATVYRNKWGVSQEVSPGAQEMPLRRYWRELSEQRRVPKSTYAADFAGEQDQYPVADILAERLIGELQKAYDFKGGTTVIDFLRDRDNLFLAATLLSAPEKIRDYFGYGPRPVLKVSIDPEAKEDQQLFLVIRTKLSPRVARTLLAALDKEWWQNVFPATEGKMTISLEYL